jgi:hypothetical protein
MQLEAGVATVGRDIFTHRERQGAWRPTLDAPRTTLDREQDANTAAPVGSRYYITAILVYLLYSSQINWKVLGRVHNLGTDSRALAGSDRRTRRRTVLQLAGRAGGSRRFARGALASPPQCKCDGALSPPRVARSE